MAYLSLGSTEPIDEQRKAEIRALLAPLTASLHASRNWEIAVTDELSGLFARRYFETRLAEEWARHRRYAVARLGRALRPRPLQEDQRHPRARRPATWRSAGSARSCARPSARATSPAATAARSSPCSFRKPAPAPALAVADRVRRALERERFESEGKPFRVTVSAGVADTHELLEDERGQLLFRADKALYAAKDEGRNRARLWTDRRRVPRAPPLPLTSARDAREPAEKPDDEGRQAQAQRGVTRLAIASASDRAQAASDGRTPSSPSVRPRSRASRRRGSSGASLTADPAAASSGANRGRPSPGAPRAPVPPPPSPAARRASTRPAAARRRWPPGRGAVTMPVSPSCTNSSGPPASSVVRTALPDRNASSGT